MVEVWTDGMIDPGARVMAEREAWIASSGAAFATYHADIADGWSGGLSYEPALGGRSDQDGQDPSGGAVAEPTAAYATDARVGDWTERLRRAMRDNAERDRRRGSTQAGPQRDDLVIRAVVEDSGEERDLRTYGSGGQQRTAAIALRVERITFVPRCARSWAGIRSICWTTCSPSSTGIGPNGSSVCWTRAAPGRYCSRPRSRRTWN